MSTRRRSLWRSPRAGAAARSSNSAIFSIALITSRSWSRGWPRAIGRCRSVTRLGHVADHRRDQARDEAPRRRRAGHRPSRPTIEWTATTSRARTATASTLSSPPPASTSASSCGGSRRFCAPFSWPPVSRSSALSQPGSSRREELHGRPGGCTGTPRAPLRQTRGGRSAARGSLLWTPGTTRSVGGDTKGSVTSSGEAI